MAALVGAAVVPVLGAGTEAGGLPVGQLRTGRTTWYDDAGTGACGTAIDASAEDLAAVPAAWWTATDPNDDPLCTGISVEVGYQGRTVTVPVRDQCPGCPADHLDLSRPAFRRLADPDLGVVDGITWRFVDSGSGGAAGPRGARPSGHVGELPAEAGAPAAG
ncbi:cysteine/serine endopeptidase inhibitor [Streptomyces sp. NRRL B-24484]|uniref:cysteine/serine endopeptidase inhibitor n=1 Tax=Streptomyces sp. NRRL B-24484 TaxID=1463833 RepID=UPI0007C5C31B|nr:cysteine/serine endopeptidase inhibitor [Streptomyces sp. NRRL B-24484]